jgi:mono/diheme cytochrome c family protein
MRGRARFRSRSRLVRQLALCGAVVAAVAGAFPGSSHAQSPPSREDARAIELGKDIFKTKANCQFCHKWDGSGDQGYGGNALTLRQTQLTLEQLAEVIQCGRPATGMPYFDQFAYTDKRCFEMTRADLGNDMPPMGAEYLQKSEIAAVVKYLFARVVGRGPATYEDCVDFWGTETRQCDRLKK